MLDAKEVSHTLQETIEYPVRPERRSTKEYIANHERLVEEDGIGCFMCEMMGLEPLGDHPLETHHIFEHAEETKINYLKMQFIFDKGIYDYHGYCEKLKGTPVESVDDIRNLVVLCKHHHIMKGCSAHLTSKAMFITQLGAVDGWEVLKGAIPEGAKFKDGGWKP